MLNWLALLCVTVVLAFIAYRLVGRPIVSAFIASGLVAIGLQVMVRLDLGYWDKFALIAFITSFSSALFVSSIAMLGWHRFVARMVAGR